MCTQGLTIYIYLVCYLPTTGSNTGALKVRVVSWAGVGCAFDILETY
jgi:hypothetical protein